MHEVMYKHPGWDQSNCQVTDVYNRVIRELSEANHLILADVYAAEVGVDWAIDMDHCHPNDLGHRLIVNRVFEAIARRLAASRGSSARQPAVYGRGGLASGVDGMHDE